MVRVSEINNDEHQSPETDICQKSPGKIRVFETKGEYEDYRMAMIMALFLAFASLFLFTFVNPVLGLLNWISHPNYNSYY